MKKIVLTGGLIVSLAACSSAQKNEPKKEKQDAAIPAVVEAAFKKHYPNITDADWEKEAANYEVSFEVNKAETSVVIDPSGQILETETEVAMNTLPQNIRDYVAVHYKGQNIKEAAKIVLADGSVQYEAEVGKKDLIFDTNGTFIKEIGH